MGICKVLVQWLGFLLTSFTGRGVECLQLLRLSFGRDFEGNEFEATTFTAVFLICSIVALIPYSGWQVSRYSFITHLTYLRQTASENVALSGQ